MLQQPVLTVTEVKFLKLPPLGAILLVGTTNFLPILYNTFLPICLIAFPMMRHRPIRQ